MWAVMCVYHHVCHTQARSCLSTGWALDRCFAWFCETVAVLAQGEGGGVRVMSATTPSCGTIVPPPPVPLDSSDP